MSGLTRSYSESPTCGFGGPIGGVTEYTFHRVPTSISTAIRHPDFKVHKGSRGPAEVFGTSTRAGFTAMHFTHVHRPRNSHTQGPGPGSGCGY